MAIEEPPAPDRPILEYARPMPPRWPKVRAWLKNLHDAGPWFPKPSTLTLVLFLACCAAGFWLSQGPQAWRILRTDTITMAQTTSGEVAYYLPKTDAVFALDANSQFKLWRPWTGQTLFKGELAQRMVFASYSADESLALIQTDRGTALWDFRTGQRRWRVDDFLGPEARNNGLAAAALSPDGSRMVELNHENEIMLWDLTGTKGKLLTTHPKLGGNHLWDATLSFSPDGRHVLMNARDRLILMDADTLRIRFESSTKRWYGFPAAFLDEGRRLVTVTEAQPGNIESVQILDTATGEAVSQWTPGNLVSTRLAIAPGDGRILVGSERGLNLLIDRSSGEVRRIPPLYVPQWGDLAFFPDGRRVLAPRGTDGSPAIFDSDNGRHMATLRLPVSGMPANTFPPTRRLLIAADGKHASVILSNGTMHTFEQVGPEAEWGVLAAPSFWVLSGMIALLVISLSRDAMRTRRSGGGQLRWRGTIVASYMILLGGIGLICPFTWAALGLWDRYTWWYRDGWIFWLTLLHLLTGFGILMRSHSWPVIGLLVLVGGLMGAMAIGIEWSGSAQYPERVFDRLWVLPPALGGTAGGLWIVLSVLALFAMVRSKVAEAGAIPIASATTSPRDEG